MRKKKQKKKKTIFSIFCLQVFALKCQWSRFSDGDTMQRLRQTAEAGHFDSLGSLSLISFWITRGQICSCLHPMFWPYLRPLNASCHTDAPFLKQILWCSLSCLHAAAFPEPAGQNHKWNEASGFIVLDDFTQTSNNGPLLQPLVDPYVTQHLKWFPGWTVDQRGLNCGTLSENMLKLESMIDRGKVANVISSGPLYRALRLSLWAFFSHHSWSKTQKAGYQARERL